MVRRFLLPLLGIALFASTAATAQTVPAKPAAGAYARPVARPGRTLTAREKRAAEATAKAQAAQATVAAAQVPATASSTSWNGWGDEPVAAGDNTAAHRPTANLSVAPGMPINQVGHGVTTDYNGRPLRREVASTTITTRR
ncbi:hypothetical protein QMK33_13790 [Hymenobacter sp. H14-R3]|uniref:hypothetical protein n=1 Tax=Hymenobacter sp. H14-R3 TaxID=3046308 RepID=UPI0024BB162F|nr:hypothetical protein [Hymenobacter sp. H14-R3]MDJ0366226.1 hypothetical protein [Hymenobacter sp. H14-R3]